MSLARLHRAGELTPVWVPDESHEAMRDLVRARDAAQEALKQLRQQAPVLFTSSRPHLYRAQAVDTGACPLA